MPQTHTELLCELTDVSESFSRLSEKLSEVASELRLSGIPPTQTFVDELAASRSHFDALRTRAIELASVLTTPQGKRQEEEVSSLSDLKALLQSLGDVQDKKAADERVQQDALNVLDCILAMVYRDDAEFQPLNDCQQKARELCAAVAALKWPDLHPEATLLAHRRHPFAELLTLVDDPESSRALIPPYVNAEGRYFVHTAHDSETTKRRLGFHQIRLDLDVDRGGLSRFELVAGGAPCG